MANRKSDEPVDFLGQSAHVLDGKDLFVAGLISAVIELFRYLHPKGAARIAGSVILGGPLGYFHPPLLGDAD